MKPGGNHARADEEILLEKGRDHTQRQRDECRDERDDESLAGNEPPHLLRRRADRAKKRQLAVTLLHRERKRAREHEDRNERFQDGEDRQARDDVGTTQRVIERFCVAAARAREHAEPRAVKLFAHGVSDAARVSATTSQDAEQVDATAAAGEPSSNVGAEEDGSLLG